jgi:hypothetical protein
MPRFAILLFCFVAPATAFAQDMAASRGTAGINDDGVCARPCIRAGGRPCRPCLPGIGPADPNWSGAVAETAEANALFGANIREHAERDPEYRQSRDYAEDRKTFHDTREAVEGMNKVVKALSDAPE